MDEYLTILTHDLHKIKTKNYSKHSDSLPDKMMKIADSVASMISRNMGEFENKTHTPYRRTILSFKSNSIDRISKIQLTNVLTNLFSEKDPIKLHEKILDSNELNSFNEAQNHPFTSLKYHLLLTCALYYNLKRGHKWYQLHLHENPQKCNQFQIIYKDLDSCREWVLLPSSGLSRVQAKFHDTWDRRLETIIEDESIDNLLSRTASWSMALAIMEEVNQRRISLNKRQSNQSTINIRTMNLRRAGSRARDDHQG